MYALGGVLVELFGERVVWANLSSHAIMYHVGEGKFPKYGHLSSQVQNIVSLCLCRKERKPVKKILKELLLL